MQGTLTQGTRTSIEKYYLRTCCIIYYYLFQVYGIMDGVLGLATGKLKLMDWPSVAGWVAQGGAYLGTKRAPPKDDQLPQISQHLKAFGIQALLIIGGFEVNHKTHYLFLWKT